MNLTSVFKKDAAIVDHTWMREGIIHPGEPQLDISKVRNPNNVKPQLEVEWGGGGPNIDLEEPAGKVKRNLPEDAEVDAGPVILFARDMMNRGFSLRRVATALRGRYGSADLKNAKEGLTGLFKLDGVIGRVAVDGRGYPSCKDALKAASKSPYKRFIRYVVGCECGEPHMMPPGGPGAFEEVPSTGNPMDDFLASSDNGGPKSMVAHCRSTMLPILSTVGDLDPSDLDQTLVEMMNVTPLPQSVRDEVVARKTSNLDKLAAAFRWLDRAAEDTEGAKYAKRVDNSEFRVARSETAVELDDVPQAGIDMDLVDPSVQSEVDIMDAVPTNFDGVDNLVGVFDEVDLAEQVPVQDIEMGQFMEPEFEGTDEVVLEEPPDVSEILDVEMLPRMDDENEFLANDRKAMDFPTQDAMDKYLKEHPDADKSLHRVVETKKEQSKLPSSDKKIPVLHRQRDRVNAERSNAFTMKKGEEKSELSSEELDATKEYNELDVSVNIFDEIEKALKDGDSERGHRVIKDALVHIEKMDKMVDKLPVHALQNGEKGIRKYHKYLRDKLDQIDITL